MSTIIPAIVAPVKIGDAITFEGLKLEDGRYAIAVQQVVIVFSVNQEHASRDIKTILGASFQFTKISAKRAERQNRPENALLVNEFSRLIIPLVVKGNKKAIDMANDLIGVSLEQLFADAFQDKLTEADRQYTIIRNRVLAIPDPWVRMYTKEMCDRVFGWFGAQFYWDYCYNFLTPEEKAFLNEVNPVVNGERQQTIHQHLSQETKDRLKPRIDDLSVLAMSCGSRQVFLDCLNRLDGIDQQTLNLDID